MKTEPIAKKGKEGREGFILSIYSNKKKRRNVDSLLEGPNA